MDARQGKVIRPFLGEPHSRAFKDKQAGELRWAFQSEAAVSCAKAEERHGFLGRGKWSIQMLPPPLPALTSLLSHCPAQSAGSTDHVTPLSASRSLLQCPEASPAAAKVSWLLRCKNLRIYLPWLLLAMPRTSGRQRQHKKVPSKYHCQCVDSESHREFQGGLCYLLTHVSSDNSLDPLVPSLMGWGKRA